MPAIGFTGLSLGLSDDNNPENTPHTPTRQTTGENHRLFFINNLITNYSFIKNEGFTSAYNSHGSVGSTRRSTQIITPTHNPGMIKPSTDSRRSITRFPPGKKQKQKNADESHQSPDQPKKSQKINSNKTYDDITTVSQPETSEIFLDLTQDSDHEKSKVKRKTRKQNPQYNHILSFFDDPFYREGDVSLKISFF